MSQKQEIKITCKGADLLPFDSLENFQGNLKKITKQNLDKLKKRIIRDGINVPLFVWRENDWCRILDGHQRLKALQSLREDGHIIPMIPVCYIEAEDEKDARQKLLGITSQFGEFEIEELSEWLAELDADVKDTVRLADAEVKFEPEPVEIEEDEAPPVPETPVTVRGDIYTLGNHRVMCGDSTLIDDVEKLMNGKKADMVFTDPPYGMNLDTNYSKMPGTSSNYKKVIGDDKKFNAGAMMSLVDCPIWYIWGADYFFDTIPKFFDGSITVWAKRQSAQETKVFGSAFEICWVYPKRKKTMWFERAINQSSERLGEHPTQKPVALAVNAFSENMKAINVLDLFLGSGSTLIACEQTNRICYGMELDEKYCDVIVQRYVNFTGGKVILNGQEIEWNAN